MSENCPYCANRIDQTALVQAVLHHKDEETGQIDWLAAKRDIQEWSPDTCTLSGLKKHLGEHVELVGGAP